MKNLPPVIANSRNWTAWCQVYAIASAITGFDGDTDSYADGICEVIKKEIQKVKGRTFQFPFENVGLVVILDEASSKETTSSSTAMRSIQKSLQENVSKQAY